MSSPTMGSPMDWQYDTPPATKRSYEDYTEQTPTSPGRTYRFSYSRSPISDHVYDLPSAPSTSPASTSPPSTSPLVAMSGDPPALVAMPGDPPALVQRVGTSLYNVALWTYRVATQVVGGVKRRAIETRVRRPAPTPQEEQREIIRASHRPLRSPRPRPSAGRRPAAGSSPRTPPHATGPSLPTPTHTTGPSLHTPTHTTGPGPSYPMPPPFIGPNLQASYQITGASLDRSTAIDPEYGFEVEFNKVAYWAPIVHEIEKRLIAKWGLKRARIIFFKFLHHQKLTKKEADLRTPEERAADRAEALALRTPAEVAEDEAEEAAIAAEAAQAADAAQAAETGQVDSSLLSSAPSSIEKYRPADMDQYQHVPFSSPLSSAPSSIEKYRPADLDERKSTPFSSPLSSAPASIEKYSTTGLDMCEHTPFSSPLSSGPSSIEKYRPADLNERKSTPFSSPLSSPPARIEVYSTTDLDTCELSTSSAPLPSAPLSIEKSRPARLDKSQPFSSPLSLAPASIEKYSTTGLNKWENTSFSSPLSSAPASIEKNSTTGLKKFEHMTFSSPLSASSAPASIEKNSTTGLDKWENTSFSSPLSSAPASIEKNSTTGLDKCENTSSSSPLSSSSAPASIEKNSTTGLDKCENTSFSSPLSSAPVNIEKYSTTGLDKCENTSFSSPLSSAPASIEKYRPASLDKCKFKTPRTPKTVAFHLSPTTGAPVTQVKRFIIGEAMDYIEVPSPSTTITPDTVARTEAEASDSPIEHHITHLERRRDAAILQPIFNEALPVERKETDVVDSPVSKRKINARDTIRKRKAEDARSAKAAKEAEKKAKEAEKKAKEEEARRKRDERRMPEEKVIRPLTAEWERRVDAAMAAGDATRLAATSAGSALSRRDLGTVLPVPGRDRAGGWLNDEVVTGYLQAVVDLGQSTTASAGRGKTPKYYAFNTFFYPSIREKGVGSVRKWAEKGRIGGRTLLEVERVFVPVHESAHWSLVVVSPMARAIEYFDSLGGSGTRHVGRVKAWLAQELGPAWVERDWAVGDSPSPRQANGLDCGVFAVTTAKMLTLGIDPLAYGPEDIPVQRRRMVAELLNGGFVGDFEP